ncbi:MAG: DUF2723 domain-containing protein [Candidatus Goldbacteria bacterium]|nr:DUF2723 domain-containing protein [Candidatus Goldiibacteriota bacterium]
MKNIKTILLCLLFLVLFYFYISKIPPTFLADDSPECIVSFQTLGIQHPPGYPLSTLFGKIFLFIPIGNIMFRASIMSMLFNIFTAFLLFFIMLKILSESNKDKQYENYYYSVFAALLYLFSYTVFLHGFSAKGSIYNIQAFIVAIIFICLLNLKNNHLLLYLIGLIFGISAGNHLPSSIAILPAIIIAIYLQRKFITSKQILNSLFFLIVGLSILVYLPVRSKCDPVFSWGGSIILMIY